MRALNPLEVIILINTNIPFVHNTFCVYLGILFLFNLLIAISCFNEIIGNENKNVTDYLKLVFYVSGH